MIMAAIWILSAIFILWFVVVGASMIIGLIVEFFRGEYKPYSSDEIMKRIKK